jgi:Tfp pilus assembly protein PilZ
MRRRFQGTAEILEGVRGTWAKALAYDISMSGMFLQTMSDWHIGDHVLVKFKLPTSASQIELHGTVVRVARPGEAKDSDTIGAGIVFVEAADWAIEEVRRFVETGSGDIQGTVETTDCDCME